MSETTTLDGNKYKGIFKGEKKERSGSYSSCEYERYYHDVWWSGTGIIQVRYSEGKRFVFNFDTDPSKFSSVFYDNIFMLKRGYYIVKPDEIIKPKVVADRYLERILKQVRETTSKNNPIPTIQIGPMEISDLIEEGLIAQGDGQIRLPFGVNR